MKYSAINNYYEYKKQVHENFTITDQYVICGAGRSFSYLIELFPDIKIEYCLDQNADAIHSQEYNVFCYDYLSDKDVSTTKFIIASIGGFTSEITETLLKFGALHQNIITLSEIYAFWGPRYKKQILTPMASIILLTNCNLRCKDCFQLVPYMKKNVRFDPEYVKEEIDLTFNTFSFVNNFIISGGETFLYTDLDKICDYISDHYSDKYGRLVLHTNGTIIPKDSTLAALSRLPKATVTISDYTGQTQLLKGKQLIDSLEKNKIDYELLCHFGRSAEEQWSIIGDPKEPKYNDISEVQQRFSQCSILCNQIINKKFYTCAAAVMSEICEIRKNNRSEPCLNLESLLSLTFEEKADAIGKYTMGFIEDGFFEHCKFCYGIGNSINQRFTIPGKQIETGANKI